MKILLCGTGFSEAISYLEPLLSGYRLIRSPEEKLAEYAGEADVVIPFMSRIGDELMTQGRFGFIQQYGVGLESVDVDAATRHGIWVSRIPGAASGNADSVAEHAMMLMLMLSRKYADSRETFNRARLGIPVGQALMNKKACIVGLGGIGSALAYRLHGMKMFLTGVHEYPERGIPNGIDRLFSLPELPLALEDADYVVLCLNYTAMRRHLIGMPEFRAMKKGAFLINVARGGLVDHDALLEILREQHLAGAGLDVFEEEPPDPEHPLFKENVVATPHIAGVTDVSYEGMARVIAANIDRYGKGEVPLFTVNHPDKYR